MSSVPGEGSTFWFDLPLGIENAPIVTRAPGWEPNRILVVDDSEASRRVLSEQLQGWNAGFECAASGVEAMEKLQAAGEMGAPFGIAIIHFRDSPADCDCFAQQIKSDASLSGTKLILVVGPGTAVKSSATIAYLARPVKPSQLFDALIGICGGPAAPEIRASPGAPEADGMRRSITALQRVLLAEDNIINQKVASKLLMRMGYQVDIAANGREAIEMSSILPYDVILMDCHMPELNGYDATATIRKREEGARRVPIIAMTANAMEGDREICLRAGMDDYLSKPVRPEDLAKAMLRWT
jgi:CheY-like chemotaxis protein